METTVKQAEVALAPSVECSPVPIFILGIMPRSGTHFLANLLCLHPDCTKSAIAEDGLLAAASFLDQYVKQLQRQWLQVGELLDPELPDIVLASLGDGLLEFLREAGRRASIKRGSSSTQIQLSMERRRIVTKTPMIAGLRHFFRLFPDAHLLILVRDGRAVVESNVQSFLKEPEQITRLWVRFARKIIEFDRDRANANRAYLIVRYEELVADPERELRLILPFLGLDLDSYDFQAARSLPVVGSSTFKRGAGPVHWFPVLKTDDFNPMARADHWQRAQHERFNWLAAEYLSAFGYEPKTYSGNRTWWRIWNHAMDAKWSARLRLRKIRDLLRAAPRRLKGVLFETTG